MGLMKSWGGHVDYGAGHDPRRTPAILYKKACACPKTISDSENIKNVNFSWALNIIAVINQPP